MIAEIEFTDTFAGEANYSWVIRKQFAIRDNQSRRSIVRQAKRLIGETGSPTRTHEYGDMIQLDFVGRCVRAFITFSDG